MNPVVPARRTAPTPLIVSAFLVAVIAIGVFVYFRQPAPHETAADQASAEAKAYVRNLELSDVTMQATENFMNQQVVEVQGQIANHGPRPLRSVEVYCLFEGVDGHEIARQRLPIVQSKTKPLKSEEKRAFRLPFDNLPEGWNQAMPKLVIARITFGE